MLIHFEVFSNRIYMIYDDNFRLMYFQVVSLSDHLNFDTVYSLYLTDKMQWLAWIS